MKKKFMGKRLGSGLLALTLVLGLLLGSMGTVFAGDTYPYVGESAEGENQPTLHGYRVEDVMQWSPETDPYAEMLRAQVPLQNRNAAFTATQANPNLTPLAQYLTLTGDYGNSFFNSDAYTNEFSTHVFNFWQYVDQYASWHGMPSVGTPEELNDVKDERNATDGGAWQRRYFEFGLVNLPNPAYTNAAHKNGVLSLGCMFQPRAFQNFEVMLYKDENGRYPVADKLTEMAKYYGFDGYFFNMEGRGYSAAAHEQLKAFLAQMRADGMYIQWYNAGGFSTNMLTSATENNYENATLYANSIFQEYGTSVAGDEKTKPYGLDKYEVAFNGFEAGRDRWGNRFTRLMKDGVMNASIASLGTDFVQTGLEKTVRQDEETGYNLFSRELDEYQWMAFERERLWWTGNNNSNTTNVNAGLTGTAKDVDARDFTGIADYIAERSVVRGDTFYTNFNTGHGLEYKLNGELSSTTEWSNINLQDILPTWQWWFDVASENDEAPASLSAEFDYGSKWRKVYYSGEEGQFGFDLVGAYNGGSSLVVYGAINAENFLHLYKSDLDVSKDSRMAVTFKKTSEDASTMKLGLIFADDTEKVVKLDIASSEKKSENWVTSVVDLSAYAGKKIAAFGLVFEGNTETYQMNIGQLRFTSGADVVPEAPTGFRIVKAYEDGEMTVSWNKESYDKVKQYNLYALVGGHEMFLGGIYDENYYIKNVKEAIAEAAADYIKSVSVSPKESEATAGDTLDFHALVDGYHEDAGQVTLVIKAVSADGTESKGTTATYNYGEAVKNVKVDNATDGQLVLTWEGGAADVTVTTAYEKEARTWKSSGTNGCTVTVPTGAEADGAHVTVRIAKNGVTTAVDTTLPDKYCKPYDGRVYGSDGRLTQPMSTDWAEIHWQVVTDKERGKEQSYKRGHGGDHSMLDSIPNTADGVYVWLVDYSGNVSAEVYVNNLLGVFVSSANDFVQAGTTEQFTATVKNFSKTDKVTWSVSGNNSPETKIDENGLLTIAGEEGATRLTVSAASVEDSSVTDEKDVSVLPAYVLKADSDKAYKGSTVGLAVYYKTTKLPTEDYEWSVTGYRWGNTPAAAEGTTIINGQLTIAENETNSTLRVTAKKGDVSYTFDLSVVDLYGIKAETDSVFAGETASFWIENLQTGEKQDAKNYTWTVAAGRWSGGELAADTKIDENGVLTLSEYETTLQIEVTATSKGGAAFSKTVNLTPLYAVSPEDIEIEKGATQQFEVKNKKTGEVQPASDFTWSVEAVYTGPLSEKTTIDETGLFTMGEDEDSYAVGIIATHKATGSKYKAEVYPPYDWYAAEPETPVAQSAPMPTPVTEADSIQKVLWTVEGAKSEATKIDENGKLTIGIDEPEGVLTVKATSALDETKFDTAVVNVAAKAKYTVTVICGEHGKVTPGTGEYYEGTEVEYTFTPDAHYELDKVLVNGQEVTVKDNKGTLTVTANATLEASFKPIMHTVEVEAGKGGKVTPGTGEYAEGSEVTFTVEADKGYEVSKVTVNGKDVTLKDGKFTVVIEGKTAVKATFKAIKNPTTGDSFTPLLTVVLAVSALAAAVAAFLFLRKKRAN